MPLIPAPSTAADPYCTLPPEHRSPDSVPAPLRYLAGVALVGVGYVLAGQLDLVAGVPEGGPASVPLWPPAGVALAVLLRFGIGLWPGVALGAVALHWGQVPQVSVAATVLGAVAAAVTGAWLLRRSGRFHWPLRHPRHLFTLFLYGGVIANLVGSAIAFPAQLLTASDPGAASLRALLDWLGNAGGVLLVTPLLLLWGDRDRAHRAAATDASSLRLNAIVNDKVLTQSLNALCLFDLQSRHFDDVNPQFTRLTGYTLDQLNTLGNDPLLSLLHPHDRGAFVRHRQVLAGAGDQDAVDIEFRLRRADGRWVWLLSQESVVERDRNGSARRVLGNLIDVTARNEAQFRQRRRDAAFASAQQRIVVAEVTTSIAHQLNQPLAALTNYCEAALSLVRDERSGPAALLRNALRQACDEAQRASAVARSLGALVEREKRHPAELVLEEVIASALAMIEPDTRHNGIALNHRPEAGAVRIMADRRQIEQVVLALLHNSVEAMRRAASPVREIVVRTTLVDQGVEVAVEDSGPGLAMTPGNEVFDPWDPNRHHGRGINLAACRSIVEAHGGHLYAGIGEKGGAALRCTLPLATRGEHKKSA